MLMDYEPEDDSAAMATVMTMSSDAWANWALLFMMLGMVALSRTVQSHETRPPVEKPAAVRAGVVDADAPLPEHAVYVFLKDAADLRYGTPDGPPITPADLEHRLAQEHSDKPDPPLKVYLGVSPSVTFDRLHEVDLIVGQQAADGVVHFPFTPAQDPQGDKHDSKP